MNWAGYYSWVQVAFLFFAILSWIMVTKTRPRTRPRLSERAYRSILGLFYASLHCKNWVHLCSSPKPTCILRKHLKVVKSPPNRLILCAICTLLCFWTPSKLRLTFLKLSAIFRSMSTYCPLLVQPLFPSSAQFFLVNHAGFYIIQYR